MCSRLKAGDWDRWNYFAVVMVPKRLISEKTGFKLFSDRFSLHIRQMSKPIRDIVTATRNIAKPNFLVLIP